MKIAIGSDHRGYEHRQQLLRALADAGHQVTDCGNPGRESSDYPDAAFAVARLVAAGDADAGILICGSGIGMSIAANKVAGVRASLCCDEEAARQTREHNDSNVLCLSGDRTTPAETQRIAAAYLAASFAGGRHGRRVAKITAWEAEHAFERGDRHV
jgi:RpiB/LacA/LacB family sugar-phosphate isomerase